MKLALSIICDELARMRPDLLSAPLVRYKRPRASRTLQLTPDHLKMRGARLIGEGVDAGELAPDLLYIVAGNHLPSEGPLRANILCVGSSQRSSLTDGEYRIVELASDADPFDVLEAVLAIFELYDAWQGDFMRAIMGRMPLESVLGIGCSLFRNPVSLTSPSLENLALAGAPLPRSIKGSIWETILDKGYSPFEAIRGDELDRLITEIENGNLIRLSRPQQAYSDNCFLIAPVNDGSRFPPALASSDICESFTDGQVDLIASVAAGIEIYLKLTDATGHVVDELAFVTEMMFKGADVDERRMEHALERHQWHAEDAYVLACILGSENLFAEAIGARVAGLTPDALVVRVDEHPAIVVNCTRADGNVALDALDAMLVHMGLHGGASYTVHGFHSITRALEQAEIAAQVASAQATPGLLRFADDYVSCIVHALEQRAERPSFAHPAVVSLGELDKGAILIDTLACYLRHDGNASRTARSLFLHRSTLAYRLNRIESATGLVLKELSEDEATALLISCLIVRGR